MNQYPQDAEEHQEYSDVRWDSVAYDVCGPHSLVCLEEHRYISRVFMMISILKDRAHG